MFIVDVWCFERGWDPDLIETKKFETKQEMDAFIVEHNSQNTAPSAPDIYYKAIQRGHL